jgi:hypothetical protein
MQHAWHTGAIRARPIIQQLHNIAWLHAGRCILCGWLSSRINSYQPQVWVILRGLIWLLMANWNSMKMSHTHTWPSHSRTWHKWTELTLSDGKMAAYRDLFANWNLTRAILRNKFILSISPSIYLQWLAADVADLDHVLNVNALRIKDRVLIVFQVISDLVKISLRAG